MLLDVQPGERLRGELERPVERQADQTDHQLRKVEFFDRKNDRLKTLNYSNYRLYDGGVWRAHLLAMENHQTGKSTDLKFDTYEFGLDYSAQDFEKGRLSRLR